MSPSQAGNELEEEPEPDENALPRLVKSRERVENHMHYICARVCSSVSDRDAAEPTRLVRASGLKGSLAPLKALVKKGS